MLILDAETENKAQRRRLRCLRRRRRRRRLGIASHRTMIAGHNERRPGINI